MRNDSFSPFLTVFVVSFVVSGLTAGFSKPAFSWESGETPKQVIRDREIHSSQLLTQAPTQIAGAYSDENCISCGGTGTQVGAESLDLVTEGHIFEITQLQLWGFYYPSGIGSSDDWDVIVHFLDPILGMPGVAACTYTGLIPTSQVPSGLTIQSLPEVLVTIDLPSPCGLADGVYFVEIYTNCASDDWVWEFGTTDPINGNPGLAASDTAPGTNWGYISDNDFAINIIGIVGVFGDGFESGDTSAWSAVTP